MGAQTINPNAEVFCISISNALIYLIIIIYGICSYITDADTHDLCIANAEGQRIEWVAFN